ncbi:hypothetical protein [Variovorax arabinosiphilus]|uniref:hypothetical protein n=1 Tax=Variovorax arabinosiphilus TaxID=3053498 RepID=UPI002577EE0A|nr:MULTISPECIES: hypothetical protein [unclassified Variovorax]MDM0121069.1 hypothetical protein [Variovorax sp. J2L1-78]MDM0130130.1 hypothetical protein [Variovorax sp. J2L1-63]MDM0233832.1 hypothetical protein [Variovorax sp. J2R1-6]
MSFSYCRAVVRLVLVSASAWVLTAHGEAAAGVKLFKIVSPRDDIVVGVDVEQLGRGSEPAVQRLAALLADKGQVTLWQYASAKEADGALVQAPLRQIAVFKSELLRIEPYSTPLPIRPFLATAK